MIHGFDNPHAFDYALIEPVFYMMRRGIKVDPKEQRILKQRFEKEWEEYQAKLNAVAGHKINAGSPKQIKQLLYKELGLPVRRNRGKVTTDENAIRSLLPICEQKVESLKTQSARMRWMRGYVALQMILRIRGIRKMIESYLNVSVDDDGRMRTTLSIGGTETFRFSSSKTLWGTGCNLQTIPRKLRTMFVADEGKELAEFDLNRGESWVYSHLANEPTMMQIHQDGEDFHAITACGISEIFGETILYETWKEFDKANPERAYKLRFTGKKVNHASAYRMGAYELARSVNKEADETGVTLAYSQARECSDVWLNELYPFIERWWDDIEVQLNDNMRTLTTPYGRVRQFHERWGDSLFKEATAYVPQSTSVDYLNGGMLRVYTELVKPKAYGIELLHQNHDAILIQYDGDRRDEVVPKVIELLESDLIVGQHMIRIPVEAKHGQNWKDLTEYGEAA